MFHFAYICKAEKFSNKQAPSPSNLGLHRFSDTFGNDFTDSPIPGIGSGNNPGYSACTVAAELFESASLSSDEEKLKFPQSGKFLSDFMLSGAGFGGMISAETLWQIGCVEPRATKILGNHEQASRGDMLKAQVVAEQMRACETIGSCGHHQVISVKFCNELRICDKATTAQDVWRYACSPLVCDAAEK